MRCRCWRQRRWLSCSPTRRWGRRSRTSCTSELATKSLTHWINDGLMVVFFLVVGMEIKREVVAGELSRPSQVALPIAGALGGILVPAAIYAAFTWNDRVALHGWAIPSATDIAFAAALLSALGSRVPPGLRLFLLTLAIVDDLAAILIIAIFYTADLSTLSLALAGLCILVLIGLNLAGVRRLLPYLLVGVVLWMCVLKSGVHATLSGVVLAFCLPLGDAFDRLEHALKSWVLLLILPLFAFANSGLDLGGLSAAMVRDPIVIGIAVGLFVGKQLGIFAGAAALIGLGVARHAGRRDVAAALWRRRVRRHRLHHEPVHRHARLRRRRPAPPGPARRAGGLGPVGGDGICHAAGNREEAMTFFGD